MRIESITLVGFIPLAHNNIHRLQLTTSSMYQLILGTNGSGKSAVMSQLNPLPAAPADYEKGGSKEVIFSHQGKDYRMVSQFKQGGKHSLYQDNTPLYEDVNSQVMKEAIQNTIGLTEELFNLLAGITTFTDMTPQKRREWLTLLCDTDFTFALNFHQGVKSQLRDMVGVVKHVKSRIVQETNTLKGYGDIDAQEQQYQQIHQELNTLFQATRQDLPDSDTTQQQLEDLDSRLWDHCNALLTYPPALVPQDKTYQCLEDIQTDIEQLRETINVDTQLQNRLSEELSDLEALVQGVSEKGVESLDELYKRRQENQARIDTINQEQQVFDITLNPQDAKAAILAIETDLRQALLDLPDNSGRQFTKEQLLRYQKEYQQLAQEAETLRNQASHRQGHLNHLQAQDDVTCPKCSHVFKIGVTETVVEQLQTELNNLTQQVQQKEIRQQQLSDDIEAIRDYSERYRQIKQWMVTYPVLKPLWDYLSHHQAFTHSPSQHLGVIDTFYQDVVLSEDKQKRLRDNEELTSLIQSMEKQDKQGGFVSRRDKLNQHLHGIMTRLRHNRDHLDRLKRYQKHTQHYFDQVSQVESLIGERDDALNTHISALRNDQLKEDTHNHQLRLAQLTQSRQTRQSTQGILKDLEDQRRKVDHDHDVLAALEKTLSPTHGLIAEQLSGFIKGLVTHMNEVIKQVWTYDLVVLPCGLDAQEQLDYKFPLEIRDSQQSVKDIAIGSQSQRDIINLAFRLVAMVYLKMEDFPLYLDEVGSSFDDQHRINIMQTIKGLVDSNNYTQLFMINHYVEQFGVFTNADICVLNDENITVPSRYNDHVILE